MAFYNHTAFFSKMKRNKAGIPGNDMVVNINLIIILQDILKVERFFSLELEYMLIFS